MKKADATDAYDARLQAKELIENFRAGQKVVVDAVLATTTNKMDIRDTAMMIRMGMCWIVISLAKFVEFWRRYGALAADDQVADAKEILKIIRDRNVEAFRNQVAAHMLDKGTTNPVPLDEVQRRVLEIWGSQNPEPFLVWLEDPTHKDQATVCAMLRRFRAHLKVNYEMVDPAYVTTARKLDLPPREDD